MFELYKTISVNYRELKPMQFCVARTMRQAHSLYGKGLMPSEGPIKVKFIKVKSNSRPHEFDSMAIHLISFFQPIVLSMSTYKNISAGPK